MDVLSLNVNVVLDDQKIFSVLKVVNVVNNVFVSLVENTNFFVPVTLDKQNPMLRAPVDQSIAVLCSNLTHGGKLHPKSSLNPQVIVWGFYFNLEALDVVLTLFLVAECCPLVFPLVFYFRNDLKVPSLFHVFFKHLQIIFVGTKFAFTRSIIGGG